MSIWDNAFKINRGRELTQDEKDFLVNICKIIKRRKLETIALLMVESTRPVHTIISNILYFAAPSVGFVFPKKDIDRLNQIFENPKGLEFFKDKLTSTEEE